jgi:hypothetical protein
LCAIWGGRNGIAEVLTVHWRLGDVREKGGKPKSKAGKKTIQSVMATVWVTRLDS